MPDTYNIQVRLGRTKITLTGATSYQVTECSGPPEMQTRAPKGGKKIVNVHHTEDASAIIHAIPVAFIRDRL